ncbi:MAG: MlaD family protein [Gammaproteobacteria bacterium]|nr:MlaD family protein [Gammaproteobacteria bacterium]
MRKRIRIFVLVMTVGLAACQSNLRVDVPFEDALGLHSGDAVYLEQKVVGRVESMTRGDNGVIVTLLLDPKQISELRSGAAAMIMHDDGKRYVQLFNSVTGDPLAGGLTLLGLNSAIEYLAWVAGDAIDRTNESLTLAAQSLHEYLESEAWQQRKQEMERDLSRLGESLRELGEQAQQDFGELTEELEKESERAAEHYQTLADELAKAIVELNRRGQGQLADSLHRLLRELDSMLKRSVQPEENNQRRT